MSNLIICWVNTTESNPDYGAIKFQLNHTHIMLLQENYIHSSSTLCAKVCYTRSNTHDSSVVYCKVCVHTIANMTCSLHPDISVLEERPPPQKIPRISSGNYRAMNLNHDLMLLFKSTVGSVCEFAWGDFEYFT